METQRFECVWQRFRKPALPRLYRQNCREKVTGKTSVEISTEFIVELIGRIYTVIPLWIAGIQKARILRMFPSLAFDTSIPAGMMSAK
jgi:hypothetical protein